MTHLSGMEYKMKDKLCSMEQFLDKSQAGVTLFKLIKKILPVFILKGDYFKWKKKWRSALFFFWRLSHSWVKEIENLNSIRAMIIEEPLYLKYLVKYLKKKGIKIIAAPQNIETLFENYCKEKYRFHLLKKELFWLRQCDLVITNSREEAYFFKNNNIKVMFHKYYPPGFIENRLLQIRKSRNNLKKEIFVLLGNAGNKATEAGMHELMEIWKNNLKKVKLYVVGYYTEGLKPYANNSNVIFLGPLPDDDFDKLLIKSKAVICYQKKGPGALTRIAEMLVAGVPVIANSHALRSYYNMEGVFGFDNTEEFVNIVKTIDKEDKEINTRYDKPKNLRKKIRKIIVFPSKI